MVKTEKMDEIIEKSQIILEFAPLPDQVLGYYTFDNGYYIILVNDSIKNDEKLYRTVLAEEIGHYRTTIGDITPRKYMCYSKRIQIDKKELLALKWATDFLIPTDMLLEKIKKETILNIHDLMDYFQVTKAFFMQKLEFMAKQQPVWDIDQKRSLYLNLPSVFIYEKF